MTNKRYRFIKPIFIVSAIVCLVMACSSSSVNNEDIDNDKDTIVTVDPNKLAIDTLPSSVPLKHVGALHTEEDFARVRAKLAIQAEPWLSGWNKLINNSHAQASYTPNPVVKLVRGGNSREEPDPDNYGRAFHDVAAAYQLALRWKISEDDQYAETAINILNAWATTCERISGDSNVALASGIYGYQFAIAAEILRDYEGWNENDFNAYKEWMLKVFYPIAKDFLIRHNGTCDSHYWTNWDAANLNSIIAIAILTDNRSMYNYAINYLQQGNGNGNWYKAINYVFEGENEGLAQLQEMGRDQGHSLLCIALMANLCQLTWNQGDDFYGLDDNRFLKVAEYVAKYNVARLEVPFHEYTRYYAANCSQSETHTQPSDIGRGAGRPMWAGVYAHYEKIKGLSTKYIPLGVSSTLPEGGGGDYGGNSGGFDQLGFGTLMYTRD
ncbi:alginate lyase family protein [Wenyingzhuangia sp. IMCC45467]